MASELEPNDGDLIEIFRGAYQHWAIYVGKGYVVHLLQLAGLSSSGVSSVSSGSTNNGEVKKEKLRDVIGNDPWKVNNDLDGKHKPRPVHDIVKDAIAMVGKKIQYCLVSANCEHFATKLRYGKSVSRQVYETTKSVLNNPLLGLGSVAFSASGSSVSK